MTYPRFERLLCALLAVLLASVASAAPASAPATRPATTTAASGPATNPLTKMARDQVERRKRQRVMELTRKSLELLEAKKFDQAEKVLKEAIALDPEHNMNLYNMACLKALTGQKDEAFAYLDRSAKAGFTDFYHIAKDTDLDSLRKDPRYAAFLGKKDEYIRLAADRMVAQLKEQFGENYLYEVDEQDKLIFATNTDRETLKDLKNNLMRQAHAQWQMLFEHKPDQYIAVVVPSQRDYRKLVTMPGVEGFYNHSARTLIASGLGFVTTHEFTHALHASDLDPLGQEHPIWLVEGMATLFENFSYEKQDDGTETIVPKENMRLRHLQGVIRQNKAIPLAEMFKMEQPKFVAEADRCYAEAGSVMHYLFDLGLLRPFYDEFKKTYEKDKTAKLALEKVTGKSLDDFEKDWKAWVLTRVPPTLRAGVDGPYMGVAFGNANDGMLIRTLVRDGPAQKAGLKVGDVLIAIDEIETRDEQSFLSSLNSHKAGDRITFRLRRNGSYLEIPMILGKRNDPNSGGAATRPFSSMRDAAE